MGKNTSLNNNRANAKNPNNPANKASRDNRANQKNPNNPRYQGKSKKQQFHLELKTIKDIKYQYVKQFYIRILFLAVQKSNMGKTLGIVALVFGIIGITTS